ncbi:MAG: Gfo/Idh/MocA family oxidoreductase [Planctomycetales bacterium]|nr:Gfo/Idh/MocA family oxidoreductase [Planctomycetales bacterium]
MRRITRREVIRGAITGATLTGLGAPVVQRASRLMAASVNAQVNVAIIGLGGIDIPGGVGGRGRQLIAALKNVPQANIVAICDVDETTLGVEATKLKRPGKNVKTYTDMRRVFDLQDVDAVFIATPNHWHALATIWACQAGKDVYVEKPFSHNIWEGRQMLAIAKQTSRILQVGTQRRSSDGLKRAFEYLHAGNLGAIRCARAIVYRPRDGIGKISAPTAVPKGVDYDLWCGPTAMTAIRRPQFHYEWHWFWATGNGEIGNNGAHELDVCRWAIGQDTAPPRAISIGGRFGVDDCAETPNTHIAVLDYQPAPIICEIRNWRSSRAATAIGDFQGMTRGTIVECEGGTFRGDISGGKIFDNNSRQIEEFLDGGSDREIETKHVANFVQAVQSRDSTQLSAAGREGHLSAACCHMANISHRLGAQRSPNQIKEQLAESARLADAFERCQSYLAANNIDLSKSQATIGPWVSLDTDREVYIGDHADQANQLSLREYRKPFVVPEVA